MMTPDLPDPHKLPSTPRDDRPHDDDLEVVIDITSGDEVDDDDLDDELERGGRGYVSYELDDEDTAPRSA
jgi:hypothetical protein